MVARRGRWLAAILSLLLWTACARPEPPVLTISGSALGREADVLRRQLERFQAAHPGIAVAIRPTPDSADERHQLYVQWLNARATDPDVLQLDVIWTAEFAAAEWIASLDRFAPPVEQFFPAAIAANRWRRSLYALPWFVDVGLLYWRTDLMEGPPATLEALESIATRARGEKRVPFGFVWQGARYEGLITTFLEHLGAFGGRILDDDGRVVVDEAPAIHALTFMRDAIHVSGSVPEAVLTWREEQGRFAFQNGQAAFMRNWPYALALLQDEAQSSVAGRFDVATMPAASGGAPTAALGGSVLAINAFSDQQPAAYELIAFLLEPAQMIERAEIVGQFPSRPSAYESSRLQAALKMTPATVKHVIDRAVPRPATPVYTELSELLQIALHRALTRQQDPEAALREAAAAMRTLLERVKLAPS